MAPKERFEDHCWQDVMPADDIRLYAAATIPQGAATNGG